MAKLRRYVLQMLFIPYLTQDSLRQHPSFPALLQQVCLFLESLYTSVLMDVSYHPGLLNANALMCTFLCACHLKNIFWRTPWTTERLNTFREEMVHLFTPLVNLLGSLAPLAPARGSIYQCVYSISLAFSSAEKGRPHHRLPWMEWAVFCRCVTAELLWDILYSVSADFHLPVVQEMQALLPSRADIRTCLEPIYMCLPSDGLAPRAKQQPVVLCNATRPQTAPIELRSVASAAFLLLGSLGHSPSFRAIILELLPEIHKLATGWRAPVRPPPALLQQYRSFLLYLRAAGVSYLPHSRSFTQI